MKVTPLYRWDFYKNLGTGIIAFGLIFNPVEFLQVPEKEKKEKQHCATGPEGPQCSRPGEDPARARLPRRRRKCKIRLQPKGEPVHARVRVET